MDNDRRNLCKAGLALGCAAALPACGGSKSSGGNGNGCADNILTVDVGITADKLAVNAAFQQMAAAGGNGNSIIVCRDAGGYYALDGACTHMQCDVAPVAAANLAAGFKCPCHGAAFDANGTNTAPPDVPPMTALPPLLHYAICFEPSGEILVTADPENPVDAGKRYKP